MSTYLILGPRYSGKTSWVRQHTKSKRIIVDGKTQTIPELSPDSDLVIDDVYNQPLLGEAEKLVQQAHDLGMDVFVTKEDPRLGIEIKHPYRTLHIVDYGWLVVVNAPGQGSECGVFDTKEKADEWVRTRTPKWENEVIAVGKL